MMNCCNYHRAGGIAGRDCGDDTPAGLLRPFDADDWGAFQGCESTQPRVAYVKGMAIVLDGCHVQASMLDGDLLGRDCPTPAHAEVLAEALASSRDAVMLAEAVLGVVS